MAGKPPMQRFPVMLTVFEMERLTAMVKAELAFLNASRAAHALSHDEYVREYEQIREKLDPALAELDRARRAHPTALSERSSGLSASCSGCPPGRRCVPLRPSANAPLPRTREAAPSPSFRDPMTRDPGHSIRSAMNPVGRRHQGRVQATVARSAKGRAGARHRAPSVPLFDRLGRWVCADAEDGGDPALSELLLRPNGIRDRLVPGRGPVPARLRLDRERTGRSADEVINVATAVLGDVVDDEPTLSTKRVENTGDLALHLAPKKPVSGPLANPPDLACEEERQSGDRPEGDPPVAIARPVL
jgi:hypothetical protein